jgi:hypothetical protein
VPLLPASLIEPLWVEFAALIESDQRPEFDPTHPWGCHRRRVPDRVVFDHVIAALVRGSGYERIATPGCSDRTIRDWAAAGVSEQVLRAALVGATSDHLLKEGIVAGISRETLRRICARAVCPGRPPRPGSLERSRVRPEDAPGPGPLRPSTH